MARKKTEKQEEVKVEEKVVETPKEVSLPPKEELPTYEELKKQGKRNWGRGILIAFIGGLIAGVIYLVVQGGYYLITGHEIGNSPAQQAERSEKRKEELKDSLYDEDKINDGLIKPSSESIPTIEKEEINDNSKAKETRKGNGSTKLTDFNEISATKIAAKSKNQTIIVIVGRTNCQYCVQFAPVLAEVAKEYGLTVYYVDLLKIVSIGEEESTIIDETAYNAIVNLKGEEYWEDFASTYFGSTPQTMFVRNNKVIYGIMGYHDKASTEAEFENAGFEK